jgi:hypothetical protein
MTRASVSFAGNLTDDPEVRCPPSSFAITSLDGLGQGSTLRARPADRSLVGEDRSAAGVRDQTGPG